MIKHNDLIERIDILKLSEHLKFEGKIQSGNLLCCCPLPDHNDKNPSFSLKISGENKGVWQCFSCGAKGNSIHLVQRVLDLTEEEAIEKIGQWFGFPNLIKDISTEEIRKMLESHTEQEIEEEIIRFSMPKSLDDSLEVIRYLKKRGYCELSARDIYMKYKMEVCHTGYYKDRIIIPIYDSKGDMVTFEASTLNLNQKEKKKLYPSGSPMGKLLFNNYRIKSSHVWITEGIFDAIKINLFRQPAVSLFGASLTNYQAKTIISKYNKAYFLFDGDKGGWEGAERAKKILSPYIDIVNVSLKFGDPEDLTAKEFSEILYYLTKTGHKELED